METHSSIFAWRIRWTEEPGRLWSMRSPRVKTEGTWQACRSPNRVVHKHGQEVAVVTSEKTLRLCLYQLFIAQWMLPGPNLILMKAISFL